MPEISVILPVYNAAEYLNAAIDSILKQTFTDFELIIVDDASTDKSGEIIDSYQDERIIKLTNKKNLGLTKSLNIAAEKAGGTFIARQDADDISYKNRLKQQIDFMQANPEVALLGTAADLIDKKGNKKKLIPVWTDNLSIRWYSLFGNCFVHTSTMFRREIAEKLGFYNAEYKRAQDYDLWLRIMMNKHKVANLKEALVAWREHEESITAKHNDEQDELRTKLATDYANKILKKEMNPKVLSDITSIFFHNNNAGIAEHRQTYALTTFQDIFRDFGESHELDAPHKSELKKSKDARILRALLMNKIPFEMIADRRFSIIKGVQGCWTLWKRRKNLV